MIRWHVLFSGNVQHVGFRYSAYYLARQLCLTGWVDNLSDGRVEMEAQGGPLQLHKLISDLKGQFEIDEVRIEKLEVIPGERRFGVRGY